MKNKMMSLMIAGMMTAALVTGCGGNNKAEETQKVTETIREPSTETESQQEAQSETQTEAVPEIETTTPTEPQTEKVLEQTMYMIDDVYMRGNADAKAAALAVAKRGTEITVLGEEDQWYRVRYDDKEGYVMKEYVTDSKEEAEQVVAAQEQAKKAQEAAEAAAAAQAAQEQAAPQGRYEVSRQNFDDCDGSGHGYSIIQYSDGSSETVEY